MGDDDTTRGLLARARVQLEMAGSDRPLADVETILAHVLGHLHLGLGEGDRDRPLTPEARARFVELVGRRARREPLMFVVGSCPYRSFQVVVDRRVLMPRAATYTLIEVALDTARAQGWAAPRIADVCTGSGVVALSLAVELPGARVVATDASADALAVARLNVARLALIGVGDRVTVREGDMLAPLAGERFEIIVSNPPYVPTQEVNDYRTPEMMYEPRGAYDGGADGLDLVRRLVAGAPDHLVPGGLLALEHGPRQHPAVADLFRAAGFTGVALRKDLDRADRVTFGRLPG